jgi:hypothetical protein
MTVGEELLPGVPPGPRGREVHGDASRHDATRAGTGVFSEDVVGGLAENALVERALALSLMNFGGRYLPLTLQA